MIVSFTPRALADYRYWVGQDHKTLKRIDALIDDISRNGHQGKGKPERLKGEDQPFYSRRIDSRHRMIYAIHGDYLIIIACRTHYGDH